MLVRRSGCLPAAAESRPAGSQTRCPGRLGVACPGAAAEPSARSSPASSARSSSAGASSTRPSSARTATQSGLAGLNAGSTTGRRSLSFQLVHAIVKL